RGADTLTLVAAANAHDSVAIPETALEIEVWAELRARFNGSLYEHLIELPPSGTITPSHFARRTPLPNQRKIPEVGEMVDDRRAVSGNNLLQKTRIGEQLRTSLVYEVSLMHVTRNNPSLQEQNSIASTSQQHRRDCTCAARSNYHGVVHVRLPAGLLINDACPAS